MVAACVQTRVAGCPLRSYAAISNLCGRRRALVVQVVPAA